MASVRLFLLTSIFGWITEAAEPVSKGHLLIIGGGSQPVEVRRRFVELAGGPAKAKILLLPMASREPESAGLDELVAFQKIGATNVQLLIASREQCSSPEILSRLDRVSGVFFGGGDQTLLAHILVGTPVQERLKTLFRDGAVIGGTSAGAAILSQVMITGEEVSPRNASEKFTSIRQGNIVTAEGLGFITNAVIDQHFIARRRLNRLFSVVLERPQLLGVGIDESTAVVINPDNTFEVLGENSVMVLNARGAGSIRSDPAGNLGGRAIQVDLLLRGDRFDLTRGVALKSSLLKRRSEPGSALQE